MERFAVKLFDLFGRFCGEDSFEYGGHNPPAHVISEDCRLFERWEVHHVRRTATYREVPVPVVKVKNP